MRRMTRRSRLTAAVGLLATAVLALSACSSSSTDLPSNSASSGAASAAGSADASASPGSAEGSGAPASSGSAEGSASTEGSGSADAAGGDLLANAPVADDSLIKAGSTMAKIKKRGQLVVGEALDAPLLSQQNPTKPGEVNGFDADMAKMLAIYILGKPNVKIVPPATQTREALLQNGTVDVVFNTYTITKKRAEQVSFAGPYFNSGLAIATRADNSDITSPKDLNGKTVIVGENTPAVTEVPKVAPDAKLVSFSTDPAAVKALLQGRGDAYVQDYTLLASDAASEQGMKVATNPFTVESYGIGIQHGDDAFKAFINDWLHKIEDGGQWAQAWKNTLGTVTKGDAPKPPKIGSADGS